jgi:uncharacterized protein YwgA
MTSEYLKEAAILAAFIEKVRESGHACGETLMQKAAYVMKELFGVPLSDKFRIHYYGPFSFQLQNRLSLMEAQDFVRVSPREIGVTYDVGELFHQLREKFPQTLEKYQRAIDFAAEKLGALRVKELEPLTTALFVTRQQPTASSSSRSSKLMEIKPHVKPAEAAAAIATVDEWIESTASAV